MTALVLCWLLPLVLVWRVGELGSPAGAAAPVAQLPALVRVAHVAPGALPIEVFVDGQLAAQGLPFGEVSGYLPVSPGVRALTARTDDAAADALLVEAEITLAPGGLYTVLVLAVTPGEPLLVLEDVLTGPPDAAQVRFVHASPNAPPVDVAVPGLPPLFANVAFRTVTPHVEIQPGTITVEALATGTTQPVTDIPSIHLMPGGSYTLVAIGLVGAAPPPGILTLAGS